jgi:hypothetical protein
MQSIKKFDLSKNSFQSIKTIKVGPMALYKTIKEFFVPSMADEIWFIFSLSNKSILEHEKYSRKQMISLMGIIKSMHDQYKVRLSKLLVNEFLREAGYDLGITSGEIRMAARYFS